MPVIEDRYESPEREIGLIRRWFPSVAFYLHLCLIVGRAFRLARRDEFDETMWVASSFAVLRALERVGVAVRVDNVSVLHRLKTPCVLVGNHMSTFESFVLPFIIRPNRPVAFVIKDNLLRYPVVKRILQSRDLILVTRSRPRRDFRTVLREGTARLERGISVVVFPQTTRTTSFQESEFNSMGVKLARRAGVPVIPMALKTDAWGVGRIFKEVGRIDPAKEISVWFGSPVTVTGNGHGAHRKTVEFIRDHLCGQG